MQPIYDFGGNGPLIHLAVANGFPPQTYKPLVGPLVGQYRVVSLPPRALWPGERPPDRLVSWQDTVAQDLIAGIRDYDLRDIIGIGHSFGGIATMLAAIAEPKRFKTVILLDPTILPGAFLRTLALLRKVGLGRHNPLANRADKRRTNFAIVDEAYRYFRPKKLFSDWSDEAVRLYSETLIPSTNGQGLRLAWPREWEAYYFRTLHTGSWRDLPKLRGVVPVLTIRGESSNTLFPKAAARMQRILPEMTYAEIAGHGHLFPLSAPDETRQIITGWLDTLSQ